MKQEPDTCGGCGGGGGQRQGSHEWPAPDLLLRPWLPVAPVSHGRAQGSDDVHVQ
jgi:hypothetical protein